MIEIIHGENLSVLGTLDDASFDLVYVDPPFNTGRRQRRTQLKTKRDPDGDRVGFGQQRYSTRRVGTKAYDDRFDDYIAFLGPRLEQAIRVLAPTGSLFVHLDYREVHHVKVFLDELMGRECFVNEIVWAYDYGARTKKRWSPKHDNILFYAKNPDDYTFNFDDMDRIPYMAPGLVGKEKAARGKTPTDVWWHTIVGPTSREKTGYPTQKPMGVIERIVKVHSNPGDRLLDFFAGSGTLGEAAARHDRSALLIDQNSEAIEVMTERLAFAEPRISNAIPGRSP
jgi:site-specific DNA-methyltransferase (adenine-specific)